MHKRAGRIERRIEGPLLVAALLTIPAIAIEQSNVGQPSDTIATVLNWATWLAFVAEVLPMLRVVWTAVVGCGTTRSIWPSSS